MIWHLINGVLLAAILCTGVVHVYQEQRDLHARFVTFLLHTTYARDPGKVISLPHEAVDAWIKQLPEFLTAPGARLKPEDEGLLWCRGLHKESSREVLAMRAAQALKG